MKLYQVTPKMHMIENIKDHDMFWDWKLENLQIHIPLSNIPKTECLVLGYNRSFQTSHFGLLKPHTKDLRPSHICMVPQADILCSLFNCEYEQKFQVNYVILQWYLPFFVSSIWPDPIWLASYMFLIWTMW